VNEPAVSAKAVFDRALEIEPADERRAYLNDACAGNPGLREKVERLLDAYAAAGSFLESPAPDLVATAGDPVVERPGALIGPYKLLEEIGEGGFGVVFLAEQQQPVRRRVALKVLKPGMDTRQVVARFEAERQALALMDHPNIARVLDAGATDSGRPYFVMELVRGVPITDFCDQNHSSVCDRLGLFVSVCQAVQHAHQKGIIHRDIKPSNVLVTLYDGAPVVKVIDFGIAKALGQRLTDKTLFTNFAQMVGTPLYMSPEQAEMTALDVDTRSDIYSLGVLLYQLLTGTTPFDRERLRAAGYDEIRRIIREEEPARPSTRLSTLGPAAVTVSARRQSDPKRLSQLVRGELDWIVMKALEKDRNRRYESASALAADVERYLRDEPVQACPPAAGYRLRKFVRRNRGPVLAAGVFTLLLAGGAIATAWQAWRATQAQRLARDNEAQALAEKDKAQAHFDLARDAVDKYLAAVTRNPKLHEKDFFQLRKELLETAVPFYQKLAKEHSDDPELEAARGRAYHRLADVRNTLGEREAAAADYRQMRAIFAKLVAEFPGEPAYRGDLARSQTNLGLLLASLGRPREAEAAYRAAVPLLEELAAEFPGKPVYRRDLAITQSDLGNLLRELGRRGEAEAAHRAALAVREQLVAGFPDVPAYRQYLAVSHNNLANLLAELGRLQEAEAAHRRALDIRQRLAVAWPGVPAYRHKLATSHDNLGLLLVRRGQYGNAEAAYRAAADILGRLAGEFPGVPGYREDLGRSHSHLGNVLDDLKKPVEAEAALRAARKIQEQLAADYPGVPAYRHELARTQNNLGVVLGSQERHAEEEAAYRDALKGFDRLARDFPRVPVYRQDLAKSYNNLGVWLMNRQRLGEAEAAYREALTIRERLTADFPGVPAYAAELGNSYKNFAILLTTKGELQAALAWFAKAVGALKAVLRKEPRMASARVSLGDAYAHRAEALDRLHRHGEAVTDWDRAIELADRSDKAEFEQARARSQVLAALTADPAWHLLWGWPRF
jgi:eukaryotic-like serine/threonine-protein kinase